MPKDKRRASFLAVRLCWLIIPDDVAGGVILSSIIQRGQSVCRWIVSNAIDLGAFRPNISTANNLAAR